MIKKILAVLVCVLIQSIAIAQQNSALKADLQPYGKIITDSTNVQKGLITIHQIGAKYYFEIPDTVFGKDLLVISRITKAGADMRSIPAFAGDQTAGVIIRYEKGPNNSIFIRKMNYQTAVPDSNTAMYQNLQRSNVQSIIASFPVLASTSDGKGVVIAVTDFINNENDVLFLGSSGKSIFKLGSMITDRSYTIGVKSFASNLKITVERTYTLIAGGYSSFEISSTIVLLPKIPMRPRYADARVGFYSIAYTDFEANSQGIKNVEMVKRWRLEPKPEDIDRYKNGELVDPQKPIVIYIDPTTPKQWVPYMIAGVNDWQKAFEKAGFKNAIMAKANPEVGKDSNSDLDDALRSVIVYEPSTITNASGLTVTDPRSGEILESHIEWHHNVMKLLHDMYMIQAGAIDPKGRKMIFDTELMGALIRYLVSHEVGHTLGLQHNFGSSSTVPPEKLRDKIFLEKYGYIPSVMDYARFNYVAQPEDHIPEKGIIPAVGDCDDWSIEWGYRYFPEVASASAEVPILNKLAVERLKDQRLWFAWERSEDPRAQTEDIGDNAMVSGNYGIKNLKRIIGQLPEWTKQPNHDYNDLKSMYEQVFGQYSKYVTHVFKNIGGVYETLKTVEQRGPEYSNVSAEKQRSAMMFLRQNVFTTPFWLINKSVIGFSGKNPVSQLSAYQVTIMNGLLNPILLLKLMNAEIENPKEAYKASELLAELQLAIFPKGGKRTETDSYRRSLQRNYVNKLITIISSPELTQSDLGLMVKANLILLKREINRQGKITKGITHYHLLDLEQIINKFLKSKD